MYSKIDSYSSEPTVENPITNKFYNALSGPLQQRCGELTILFDRANPKDLQHIFPILIERIFGLNGSVGWGLRSITCETNNRDFNILHHFLGPLGPVFRLIYKLLGDGFVRYDYPLSQLPAKVLSNLEVGRISPFYSDLVCQDAQTRQLLSLQMNPFDYYMFQFAWNLISPWQQRSIVGNHWSSWNTVYYVLSCDYLTHFLPTDPYNAIPVPHVPSQFTGKNPLVSHHQIQNRNVVASKLFKPQVLQQASMELNTLNQTYQHHPRSEIWRSETLIQVFVDIWLTNDQFNSQLDVSYLKHTPLYELPSGEYIRIIRFGIKQLHAFVDSGKKDISPTGELKKMVLPMIQGKMYIFLRHLIHRWPLDGSFRLLLELWLSFIQPWRYPCSYFQKIERTKQQKEDEINVQTNLIDRQYLRFIADNLLAYTIIFQQLLPRFLRIDLTSPKEAVLIYRVTKVFGQPNLICMLKEVESCVDNRNHSPSHSYSGIWSSLPPLSPTSNWSTNTPNQSPNSKRSPNKLETSYLETSTPVRNGKWTAVVRQHIFDLEGPEFFYKPMFTDKPAPEVIQLLQNLQIAIAKVKFFLAEKEQALKSKQQGVIGLLRNFFMIPTDTGDEFSIEERRKVPDYLCSAQEYLMSIFNTNTDFLSKSNLYDFDYSMHSDLNGSGLSNSMNHSNPFANLGTPNMSKQRASKIQYEGDPDLIPPRSSECSVLVNILRSVAQKINEMYGGIIMNLYHRGDLYGAVSRQFIQPPQLIKSYDKSYRGGIVSPRVQRMLPPRITLRPFASKKFIYTLIFAVITCRLLGYDFMFLLSIILLAMFVYTFFKALYQYECDRRRNIPITPDISINEPVQMDETF